MAKMSTQRRFRAEVSCSPECRAKLANAAKKRLERLRELRKLHDSLPYAARRRYHKQLSKSVNYHNCDRGTINHAFGYQSTVHGAARLSKKQSDNICAGLILDAAEYIGKLQQAVRDRVAVGSLPRDALRLAGLASDAGTCSESDGYLSKTDSFSADDSTGSLNADVSRSV